RIPRRSARRAAAGRVRADRRRYHARAARDAGRGDRRHSRLGAGCTGCRRMVGATCRGLTLVGSRTEALAVYDEGERPRFLRRADTAATWVLDVGIALVTLIPTVAVLGHDEKRGAHGAVAEILVGAVLSVAPLIVRRRWPVQVLAVILLVGVVVPGPAVFSPPALVALYTVASRRPWRVAAAGTLATVAAFAL